MYFRMSVYTLGLLIFNLTVKVFSLENNTINLVLDYFEYKNVTSLCLLLCNTPKWIHKFTKLASKKSFAVSSVLLSEKEPFDVVKFCLRERYAPLGVLIDIHCPSVNYLLREASIEMLFDELHKWLVIEDSGNETFVIKNNECDDIDKKFDIFNVNEPANRINLPWYSIQDLTKLNLSVDAEVNIAYCRNGMYCTIYDAFNFGRVQGSILNVTYIGFWNETEGLRISFQNYKYCERGDFYKTTLRVIAVMSIKPKIFYPELLTDPSYTPGVAAMTKVGSMVLELIGEMHNIRYKYTIVDRWIGPDHQNSTRVSIDPSSSQFILLNCPQNSSKDHDFALVYVVSNSLLFREQDMTPSLRVFRNYLHAFDILHPELHYIETKFFYRIPTRGVGKYENEFLTPLSKTAWICVAGAVIVCGLVIMAAACLELRTTPIQFAGFTVLASVCQQSFEEGKAGKYKKNYSGQKIAVFATGISFYVLYNYYTSSVVSWLLNATPPTIKNLHELIYSPLEIIFEDMGYTRSWLQSSNYYFDLKNKELEDKLRKVTLNKKNRKKPLMIPLKEGVELLKAGGYAYHTEPYNAYQHISRSFDQSEICELGSVQLMKKQPVHLTMQYRSPYKEFFLWSLMRLRERGHIGRIRNCVTRPAPKCEGRTPRPLSLGSAVPAFLLLGMGMAFGSLVLLYEILHDRISRYRENRKCSVFLHLN